nr:MAG TPA: hypothetical protein [Caudoviricetes sp.]
MLVLTVVILRSTPASTPQPAPGVRRILLLLLRDLLRSITLIMLLYQDGCETSLAT